MGASFGAPRALAFRHGGSGARPEDAPFPPRRDGYSSLSSSQRASSLVEYTSSRKARVDDAVHRAAATVTLSLLVEPPTLDCATSSRQARSWVPPARRRRLLLLGCSADRCLSSASSSTGTTFEFPQRNGDVFAFTSEARGSGARRGGVREIHHTSLREATTDQTLARGGGRLDTRHTPRTRRGEARAGVAAEGWWVWGMDSPWRAIA